ncbi:hypothetical protein OROHE_025090 [Orobanche hederae]
MAKVPCQRIGCDAVFSEDDNPDGSCTYHAAGPCFMMGRKNGAAARKGATISVYFCKFPDCKTGKHTTEKPVLAKVPARKQPVSAPIPAANSSQKDTCARCRQGFLCSDHGSHNHNQETNPKSTASTNNGSSLDIQEPKPPQPKKIVGINEPQICKNKGCGETYKEKDNHEAACSYHPGPPVFHDRMRGWKCCDIHVKEFDEFMSIPPCSKGWHNADAAS